MSRASGTTSPIENLDLGDPAEKRSKRSNSRVPRLVLRIAPLGARVGPIIWAAPPYCVVQIACLNRHSSLQFLFFCSGQKRSGDRATKSSSLVPSRSPLTYYYGSVVVSPRQIELATAFQEVIPLLPLVTPPAPDLPQALSRGHRKCLLGHALMTILY